MLECAKAPFLAAAVRYAHGDLPADDAVGRKAFDERRNIYDMVGGGSLMANLPILTPTLGSLIH